MSYYSHKPLKPKPEGLQMMKIPTIAKIAFETPKLWDEKFGNAWESINIVLSYVLKINTLYINGFQQKLNHSKICQTQNCMPPSPLYRQKGDTKSKGL